MVGYIRPERSYDSLGMTTLSHSYIHAYTQTAIFARSQRSDLSQASRFDLYYFHLTPTLLSTLYAHYSDITLVFVHFAHTLCVFSDGFSASLSSLFLVEALITAISNDIEEAKAKLELPEHLKLRKDNFFTSVPSSSSAAPSTAASTSQTIMNGHWHLAMTTAAVVCARTHSVYTQVCLYVPIKMHSLILRSACCRHGCARTQT